MFGLTKNTKTRGRKKLSKKQTILNALMRGQSMFLEGFKHKVWS